MLRKGVFPGFFRQSFLCDDETARKVSPRVACFGLSGKSLLGVPDFSVARLVVERVAQPLPGGAAKEDGVFPSLGFGVVHTDFVLEGSPRPVPDKGREAFAP